MFTLACPPSQSRGFRTPNGEYTNGEVVLTTAGCIAFASSDFPNTVPDPTKIVTQSLSKILQAPSNLVISADEVEVDVKIGESFAGGELVYAEIADGAPTGLVVNEAGTANRAIGYAKDAFAVSTTVGKMIVTNFDGRPFASEIATLQATVVDLQDQIDALP